MPDEYKNKKVKFYGKVVQVIEGDNEVDIRMSTKAGDYNFWFDDIIYGYYDPKMPRYRILEGDLITIYGISKGLYTYTSTEDKKITLPLIEIVKVDQQMN